MAIHSPSLASVADGDTTKTAVKGARGVMTSGRALEAVPEDAVLSVCGEAHRQDGPTRGSARTIALTPAGWAAVSGFVANLLTESGAL